MVEADIITFDCYGTLIDWQSGIVQAFQSEAARDGVELSAQTIFDHYITEEPAVEAEEYRSYRDVLTLTALRVAGRLGWRIDGDRAGFLPESLRNWRPFPDTISALQRLGRRYSLGILSNIDDELLSGTIEQLKVPFDLIVTAQQVRSYKPGYAHFKEALARTGNRHLLHAAQSYYHDVIPAVSLGIPVVWVNRNGELLGEADVRPTHEVGTLTELADWLGA